MRKLFPAALVAAAAVALTAAGCQAQPAGDGGASQDKAFGERVRAYLLDHPEVLAEAMEKLQLRQDADKAAASTAALTQHRQALEHDARDGVAGNAKGGVTLVEFFDYRCPYCKAAEPELQALLKRHPNVRLVLKEFPILDVEDQSHISEDAARAALASLPQGRYLAVRDALLRQNHLDEAGVARVLTDAHVDKSSEATGAKSGAVTTHLADNHALARAIGIDGTPAFVIGDKLIAGAQIDAIEAALSAAQLRR